MFLFLFYVRHTCKLFLFFSVMRPRSGKLVKISSQPSKNSSLLQKNTSNVEEQPIEVTFGGTGTSITVEVSALAISQTLVSPMTLKIVVPPQQPTSFLTTLRVTQTIIGDNKHPFLPGFMLPLVAGNIHTACQLH